MSIQYRLGLLFVVFAIGTAISVYLALQLADTVERISVISEKRLLSYQLADELRQSSDDLTRMTRTFAITEDEQYLDHIDQILAIRNGQAPYPDQYGGVYWDFVVGEDLRNRSVGEPKSFFQRMKDLGFSPQEFAKLEEEKSRSDELVQMEIRAINAVKGKFLGADGAFSRPGPPDKKLAQALLFGSEYHKEKSRIMRPIQEFFDLVNARTSNQLNEIVEKQKTLSLFLELSLLARCFSLFSASFSLTGQL